MSVEPVSGSRRRCSTPPLLPPPLPSAACASACSALLATRLGTRPSSLTVLLLLPSQAAQPGGRQPAGRGRGAIPRRATLPVWRRAGRRQPRHALRPAGADCRSGRRSRGNQVGGGGAAGAWMREGGGRKDDGGVQAGRRWGHAGLARRCYCPCARRRTAPSTLAVSPPLRSWSNATSM